MVVWTGDRVIWLRCYYAATNSSAYHVAALDGSKYKSTEYRSPVLYLERLTEVVALFQQKNCEIKVAKNWVLTRRCRQREMLIACRRD